MEVYQEFVLISILSLLLAFLVGRLFSFSDDDADRELDLEPMKIGGETQGNDHLRSRPIDDKCEGNNGFKEVDEARSDDDDVIEIDICDLDAEEVEGKGESSDVRVEKRKGDFDDDLQKRFEAVRVENCCASHMRDGKKSEFAEGKKFESSEEDTESISRASEVRVDGKENFDTVIVEDMCKLKEDKFELGKGDEKVETKENADLLIKEKTVLKEETECETIAEKRGDGEPGSLLSEDDEWEGIERTELQKRFHEAVTYVGSESGARSLLRLSAEEQMQLCGLYKVATEGPCYDPQPMALKVTARVKWNAWRRLGNMNPDVAMERYMGLLSEKIPGWMAEKPEGDVEHHVRSEVLDAPSSGAPLPESCFNINSQLSTETKRGEECLSCIDTHTESAVLEQTSQGSAPAN